LLTIFGTIALFLHRKNNYGLFCLFSATITFALFIRVQELGIHHFLPVAFWLFPVYVTGADFLFKPTMLARSRRLYPAALVSLAIFCFSILPASNPVGKIESFFVPSQRTSPLRVDKFSEYKKLTTDLVARLTSQQHFAVFASSTNLSDSMLVAIEPSLQPYLIPAPHIAAVQHFPFEILRSEYAIAVTPPQTHMAPGSQVNITIPGEMLLNKQGFGAAFDQEASYMLADGITAYLFHRRRAVSAAEMGDLLAELETHYPGWKPIFEKSMEIPFAAREVKLGDVWGFFSVPSPNTIFLHPGATIPTIVDFPINHAISQRPATLRVSMARALLNTCPDADGVSLTVKSDDKLVWNGIITPGQSEQIDLPQVDATLELIVDKRSQPNCDHVFAAFLFSP
jgi:hypothetical protein